ncbi:hypothetical protein HZS_7075 [Henneguya salminicola]|nr:hypothetical protein HZS_7075 [Henneguya salminicola]
MGYKTHTFLYDIFRLPHPPYPFCHCLTFMIHIKLSILSNRKGTTCLVSSPQTSKKTSYQQPDNYFLKSKFPFADPILQTEPATLLNNIKDILLIIFQMPPTLFAFV